MLILNLIQYGHSQSLVITSGNVWRRVVYAMAFMRKREHIQITNIEVQFKAKISALMEMSMLQRLRVQLLKRQILSQFVIM